MMLHTHIYRDRSTVSEAALREMVRDADMVEPSWHADAAEGMQACRDYGMKPGALVIAYRVLSMTMNPVTGPNPVPDAWCLHHHDGRVWRANETTYNPAAPPEIRFLNPSHSGVKIAALQEQTRLRGLGYAGVRYDEAAVGWLPHNAVDFADCQEFSSARGLALASAALCRALRKAVPSWIQLPSIHDFWDVNAMEINRACAGISAENFPSGAAAWGGPNQDGKPVAWRDTERTFVGTNEIADALSNSGLKYTMMFYARYALGLQALDRMVRGFGSRVYVNVDHLRRPDGTWAGATT